jgi:hypothetical protein
MTEGRRKIIWRFTPFGVDDNTDWCFTPLHQIEAGDFQMNLISFRAALILSVVISTALVGLINSSLVG